MKRMRVIAGPNGSGKSTLIKVLTENNIHLGEYCNADDYKRDINLSHRFSFDGIKPDFDFERFRQEFVSSSLYGRADGAELLKHLSVEGNTLKVCEEYEVNDYFTSFLADYVRRQLLKTSSKFTFETVMSHPSKLDFMREAKANGFKVYLYFVSLRDPEVNVSRVRNRVSEGGHDVNPEKIKSRYARTMGNLNEAMEIADVSYVFDNSFSEPTLFARVENGEVNFLQHSVPAWFREYVL